MSNTHPSSTEVLFISPHSDPEAELGEPDSGGQCIYEHQLATALSQLPNVTVTTFCRDTGRRPALSQVSPGYTIQRVLSGPKKYIPKESLSRYLPEFAQGVADKIKTISQNPIVHSHYWDGGAATMMVNKILKKNATHVWTPHSLGFSKREKFPGLSGELEYNFIARAFWENYTLFTAHHVVVSSEQEKQVLTTQYQLDDSQISIIAPGIDGTALGIRDPAKARETLVLPQQHRLLVCMGRITPFKGYHHAIDALPLVQSKSDEPVSLVIIGGAAKKDTQTKEEQRYLKQLKAQASKLGVADSVVFKPAIPHDHVATVYNAADVQLIMSEHEPFGLTALEAMACGTPVIATKNGGPRSFITHNVTGNLVDVTNPAQVASYITPLLKDQELYDFMSGNSHVTAITHYNWSTRAEAFLTAYQSASLPSRTAKFSQWLSSQYELQTVLEKT